MHVALRDYSSALVTGASSGIGAATVRRLCAHDAGLTVHAVARRRDRLDRLAADTGCVVHELDLRDTDALYDALGAIDCDVLINNAGLGRAMGGLFDGRRDDIDRTVDTNVTALYHALRALVPGMRERGRGHVVNIGSVAGLYPINSAVYGGSKGAVHLLTQNLRLELRGSGVRVTEICPGRVDTEFFDVAFDDPAARRAARKTGIEHLTAEDVVDAIVYALDAPWRVNVSTVELTPHEQTFGGFHLAPARDRG